MGPRMTRLTSRRRVPSWWLPVAGAAVLVACLVAALAVATSHAEQHRDRLQAAIVNNDVPVTLEGTYTPLGRQLAAKIMAQKDTLDWSLMTTETAKTKLRDGELVAVVTIPQDFSAKATSMATETPTDARHATVHVQTSATSGVADSAVVENVTRAGMEALSNELRETYLDNVYIGLSKVRSQTKTAASSAEELSDGAGQLETGVSTAASGGDELVVGLKQLASGGATLSDGLGQLAAGVDTLHSGTGQLAANASVLTSATRSVASGARDLSAGLAQEQAGIAGLDAGASQLASGLAQLNQQAATMPTQTHQLAAGAASVADGATQLSQGAHDAAQGAAGVSAGASQLASSLAEYSAQMATLAAADPGNAALQQAADSAEQLAHSAEELSTGAEQSAAGAHDVSQAASDLATGAEELQVGVSQLASSAPLFSGSIDQLSAGATNLSLGMRQLSGGAGAISSGALRLAEGSSQLATGVASFSAGVESADSGAGKLAAAAGQAADGASTLADGVGQAEGGGAQLADGLHRLSGGTGQLTAGTTKFADKLAEGADDAPDYSAGDRNALKKVVSAPIAMTQSAPGQSVPWVFFALLAIWLTSMGAFGFNPPLPHRLVESTKPTWRLAFDGASPSIAAGALAGLLCSIVLWFGLGLGPLHALALCAFLVFAGACFAFVNQGLLVALGGWGALVSMLLAIGLAARALFSAIPAGLASAYSATPLGAAFDVALSLATGAAVGAGALTLIGWALGAGAIVLAVVSHRRITTGVSLRRVRGDAALIRR